MLYRPIRVIWNGIKRPHLFSISWGDLMRVLFWHACASIPKSQNTKAFLEKGEGPNPQCNALSRGYLLDPIIQRKYDTISLLYLVIFSMPCYFPILLGW